MNVREKMALIENWLGWCDENLSSGLKSIKDAEKLYDYWQKHGDKLPEFPDEESDDSNIDVAIYCKLAIGYDPLNRI